MPRVRHSSSRKESCGRARVIDDWLWIAERAPRPWIEEPGLVDTPIIDGSELGHVAPDVGAFRVEAFGLRDRVEDSIRPRIGPGSCHPLPVTRVVGDVAVHQKRQEVCGATPPIDAQVLDEERGDDQARAVVHDALARELTHARVDDGIARATRLPRLERPPIDAPPVAARPVVRPRDRRKGRRHLMVEIAPAELTYERVSTGPTPCALDDLARRETAEVKIRA